MIPSHLQTLLAARKIVLWVEDLLTREYLSGIWQPEDRLINILVGGGAEIIKGLVHDFQKDGIKNVFGFIDRDFGESNYPKWNNPRSKIEVFKPTVLEIENFLLSWPALAGCNENTRRQRRTETDIGSSADHHAQTMVWWMACRSVLSDFHDLVVGNFPSHPKIPQIRNQNEAIDYITAAPWYGNFPANAKMICDQVTLNRKLTDAHACHAGQLADGSWVRHFSGKEIFRHLRGYLFNARYATDEEMDIDLAKSIADWQVANNAVPQELLELKAVLKTRVGL